MFLIGDLRNEIEEKLKGIQPSDFVQKDMGVKKTCDQAINKSTY